MKRFFSCLLLLLPLTALPLPVQAAKDPCVYECSFENTTVDRLKAEGYIGFAPKSGVIETTTLDGSSVLRFYHPALEQSEDCFIDLLGGKITQVGLESVYCLSYDFRYTGEFGCPWQILCSRQVPASGVQFQQASSLEAGAKITDTPYTLEPDRWYTFSAVMDEAKNQYDLYLDGVLIADAVPYSISDQTATLPDRLRIGFSGGTGEAAAYVDNIRITNGALPDRIAEPDIRLIDAEAESADTFPLPQYTKAVSVSRPFWFAAGTAASLILAAVGILLLRKLKEKP